MKRLYFLLSLLLLALMLGCTVGTAESICQIGAVTYEDLQAAIIDAQEGDIIELLADISAAQSISFTSKTNLTLDGNGHAILANGTGALLDFSGGSYTLKGIIVDANRNGSPAVRVRGGATLTIEEGTIIQNAKTTASWEGGLTIGVVNGGAGTVTMNGGIIRNCTGTTAGGVALRVGGFTMNGGEISGNTLTSSGSMGAGIHMGDSQLIINGGVIQNNTSLGGGGGIGAEWGKTTIKGGKIINNTATWGGGILVTTSFLYIYDTTISGNSASNYGGGIYLAGSDWYGGAHLYMYGGVITENHSSGQGGGIYTGGTANWTGCYLYENALLYNNTADKGGDDLTWRADAGTNLSFTDVDGRNLMLNDCNHLITGWFVDNPGNRYNAHDLSIPLHTEEITERDNGSYFGQFSFSGMKAAHHIYTVTYVDGVEGTAFESQQYKGLHFGADTPAFEGTPLRYGYRFTGWDPAVSDTVTGDAIYTAQWEPDPEIPEIPQYTIIYDPNGGQIDGSLNPVSSLHNYMERIFIREAPIREGYVFQYWEEPVVHPGDAYIVTEDHTFVAVWTPDPKAPQKILSVKKVWVNDDASVRPEELVLHLKKTSAFLIPGPELNAAIKNLPEGDSIQAVLRADQARYEVAVAQGLDIVDISESGESILMWAEDGILCFYSAADNIYMNPNSGRAFNSLRELKDLSGLSAFNTAYVTDMNRMFNNSTAIENLAPLAGWDTGNVTDMTFMFGADYTGTSGVPMSIRDLAPLAAWNTQKVTSTNQMFKGCLEVHSVDAIKGWNVSNLVNVNQMFNRAGLSDATALVEWDMSRVTNFNMMFAHQNDDAPQMNVDKMPIFTGRQGSWSAAGSYTPSSSARNDEAATVTKTIDPQEEYISTQDSNVSVKKNDVVWTYSFLVSNDGSLWYAWEEVPDLYTASDGQTEGVGSSEGNALQEITKDSTLYNKYPDRYHALYRYEGDLPEEVTATLPVDDATYFDNTVVSAKSPSVLTVKTGQVTYTFNGWDEDEKTVHGANVLFTGSWTATPDATPVPTVPATPNPYVYKFTFTKKWQGDAEDSIDWTFYAPDGSERPTHFGKEIVSEYEWRYVNWLTSDADYYLVEKVPEGYKVRYENVGKHAGETDRCYNGGTIINYKVPKTGDDATPALWIALAALGIGGLALLLKKRRASAR